MDLDAFDYPLPDELIAQHPADKRDASRMMVLNRSAKSLEHRRFTDLPMMLNQGDLLVVNESRVRAARLLAVRRGTGGRVEILVVRQCASDIWQVLLRPARRIKAGDRLEIPHEEGEFEVLSKEAYGVATLRSGFAQSVEKLCERRGLTPLPPYIKRPSSKDHEEDRTRYQTIFARATGSVAAPTAGLHFSDEVVSGLPAAGIEMCCLTLHVGLSTFQPIRTSQVEQHRLEPERYMVPPVTAEMISRAKQDGRRVVAVGTTTTRTLESIAAKHGSIVSGEGSAGLFIRPPYRFQVVDAMLTNFHLPRSSLLVLVAAFAGLEFVLQAYHEAVHERYRFYSYGDCMLIL
jgi:S-adenosylmethionine:tRNA ribosyltransferase-isomerase